MSITNTTIIDGIAINNNKQLVLLLIDHLDWNDEYYHLNLLQDKINAYCTYCESRQYEKLYPNHFFSSSLIEVHFLYEPTINANHFLSVVQSDLAPEGIAIEFHIDEF